MKPFTYLWLARLSIAPVFLWNMQCAIAFLFWPARFSTGFELSGIPGETAIRAVGVLFLMWNIPYAVALWHPMRYRVSLYESIAMQALGIFSETFIWLNLPTDHAPLQANIWRFILFDAGGLVLLLLAIWFAHRASYPKPVTQSM